jgi:hypothetical protein
MVLVCIRVGFARCGSCDASEIRGYDKWKQKLQAAYGSSKKKKPVQWLRYPAWFSFCPEYEIGLLDIS